MSSAIHSLDLMLDPIRTPTDSSIYTIEEAMLNMMKRLKYDDYTPSSLLCSSLHVSKLSPDHDIVHELLDVMEVMKNIANRSMTVDQYSHVANAAVLMSKIVDMCDLTTEGIVVETATSILESIAKNWSIDVRSRSRTVVEVMLRCNLKGIKPFLSQAGHNRKVRGAMPTCPAVYMFAIRTPNDPLHRYYLNNFGGRQTDAMTILQHLGREVCLERINVRKKSMLPGRDFSFSKGEYLTWPLQVLRELLNSRDFLVALFCISEEVYVSNCMDIHSVKLTSEMCDIMLKVKHSEEEFPKWYHSEEKWKRETSLRHLLYSRALQVHTAWVMGMDHALAHQELRIRRANIIYKLYPYGCEYLGVWVRFWMDFICNMSICMSSDVESTVMRSCERKFQESKPNMSHWILFLVAASKVSYSRYQMAPPEDMVLHVTDCSNIVQNSQYYVYANVMSELNRDGEDKNSYLTVHFETIAEHLKGCLISKEDCGFV